MEEKRGRLEDWEQADCSFKCEGQGEGWVSLTEKVTFW